MKLTKFTNLVVLGLILTFAAAGCKKGPGYVTKIPGRNDGLSDINNGKPLGDNNANGMDLGSGTTGIPMGKGHPGWAEDSATFKANTVHFAYDSSVVKADERVNVSAVASHLKANSADAVKVEGHCDERGTEEYNRSLGERRAQALREELVRLGIDPDRVDTASFGKDRPADPGHNESAWKQNRRGEFILLTPPK